MDEISKGIIDKINKLLALSTSPSEAEAASALEKVRLLLAKHDLTMDDIKINQNDVMQKPVLEKRRLRKWESLLVYVICQNTFCEAVHFKTKEKAQLMVIGKEVNVITAINLFEYIHNTVLKLGRKHSGKVAHLDSFKFGIVHRIGQRLDMMFNSDQQDNETDGKDKQLILLTKENSELQNKEFISENYGRLKNKKVNSTVDRSSYEKGIKEGDNISLNRQVK